MLRRFGAPLAVLALLFGLSVAPYTHAHHAIESESDELHPYGETLVHTHASPHTDEADHSQPEPAKGEESDDRIWAVNGFVCQQPLSSHAPSHGLLVFGEPHVQLTSIRLCTDRPQPKSHGPPIGSPSGLRAPPAFLPAFA